MFSHDYGTEVLSLDPAERAQVTAAALRYDVARLAHGSGLWAEALLQLDELRGAIARAAEKDRALNECRCDPTAASGVEKKLE